MRLAIVGLGNVGSAVLLSLPEITFAEAIKEVFVIGRSPANSDSAILDAASAAPKYCLRYRVAENGELENADVIIFCAGRLKDRAETRSEHYNRNSAIFKSYFYGVHLKDGVLLIVVSSPVDDLTVYAHRLCRLRFSQVIGFGGDLDYERLQFCLLQRGMPTDLATIVGEHGSRAIPVLSDENDFDEIAANVRTFLSRTHSGNGRPRNLASGKLLAQLVNSILGNSNARHFVCGYHEGYSIFLTWPFAINRGGLAMPMAVQLGVRSGPILRELVRDRLVFESSVERN